MMVTLTDADAARILDPRAVIEQQRGLAIEIHKLDQFATTTAYDALPVDERIRLVAQSDAMKTFSNVLLRRIAAASN